MQKLIITEDLNEALKNITNNFVIYKTDDYNSIISYLENKFLCVLPKNFNIKNIEIKDSIFYINNKKYSRLKLDNNFLFKNLEKIENKYLEYINNKKPVKAKNINNIESYIKKINSFDNYFKENDILYIRKFFNKILNKENSFGYAFYDETNPIIFFACENELRFKIPEGFNHRYENIISKILFKSNSLILKPAISNDLIFDFYWIVLSIIKHHTVYFNLKFSKYINFEIKKFLKKVKINAN